MWSWRLTEREAKAPVTVKGAAGPWIWRKDALAGYFINSLSQAVPGAGAFGYLSPFKFVDTGILDPAYALVWWRILYLAGFGLLFPALALVLFRKKDILV